MVDLGYTHVGICPFREVLAVPVGCMVVLHVNHRVRDFGLPRVFSDIQGSTYQVQWRFFLYSQ